MSLAQAADEAWEALLRGGLPARVLARGGSMAPLVLDGDVLLVEPLAEAPRIGDVVAARRTGGPLVLHRVVALCARGFVLQGDAHAVIDGEFTPSELFGVAVVAERRGRRRALRTATARASWRALALARRLVRALKVALKVGGRAAR